MSRTDRRASEDTPDSDVDELLSDFAEMVVAADRALLDHDRLCGGPDESLTPEYVLARDRLNESRMELAIARNALRAALQRTSRGDEGRAVEGLARAEIEAFRKHLEEVGRPVQIATRAVVNRAREMVAEAERMHDAGPKDGPIMRLIAAVREMKRQEDIMRGREPYQPGSVPEERAVERGQEERLCPRCGIRDSQPEVDHGF